MSRPHVTRRRRATARSVTRALLALAATAVLAAIAAGVPASAGGTPLTFTPVADAYVRSDSPATNFGTVKELRVRGGGSLVISSYLKFAVSGAGSVTGATLRVFVTDPSAAAGSVHLVADTTWTEAGITYSNAPQPTGGALDTEPGAATTGTWVELDVSAAVTGDGTYTLQLQNSVSDAVFYSSREGPNAPQLVLQTGPTAPTAGFTAAPTSGTAPLTVSFTDTSSGAPTSWAWDFEDDGIVDSTLQNPQFTYASPGTYTVRLTAANAQGSDDEVKLGYVAVTGPTAPTAGFTADRTSGSAPLTVSFTDTSSGAPTTWAWDFEDDGIVDSTLQNPQFTYASPGTYTVKLTAANAQGGDDEVKLGYVTVTDAASAVTVMAAGDIACDPTSSGFNGGNGTSSACHQRYTSDLLVAANPDGVLALGDLQYEDASLADFQSSYDPSWGRLYSRTYPATGNHEYQTSGASGYFSYWGSRAGDPSKGYYSFDLGAWHVVALNSSCSKVGGCGAGSPQEQWLRADLAAHPAACTLAYWHHARFNGGAIKSGTQALWQALYDLGADVVLNGHYHNYQRHAPQTPAGVADPVNGIRQFVVGTGGVNHGGISNTGGNLEAYNTRTFGVLELVLHPAGYDWEFVPEAGATFTDAGSGSCH